MRRHQTGGIFSFLLFLIFLVVAIGFGSYWYGGHKTSVSKWLGTDSKEDKGYLTYEEYLKKKEREKKLTSWKDQFEKFLQRLKGR